MSMRSSIALALVVVLLVGSAPALVRATVQAQGNGVIGGKANDEAKKPYTDYKVQLRDLGAAPPQVVATTTLDAQGRFTFNDLPLTKRYLVELYNVPKSKIVCTEGPYTLSTNLISKTDVNISCGGNPAAWWLLAAGAAAAAIAVGVRSPNG